MFPTIGFLACQILNIVRFQIETKKIFSLADIVTNLGECHLQKTNLKKLIFVNKNWPNEPNVGYKLLLNLVELIK
jgi:hypothetical protein